MLLDGLHIPLGTPFQPDGGINLHKLAANVVRYSKTPAAGLILLGPAGEPTLLSDEETRETLRVVAEAAAPEKILIAGISRDSVRATLALADYAAELNCDAALLGVPAVLSAEADSRELLTFFQTVADRSPTPIVLLSTAARAISIDVIGELAAHPNMLGLLTTEASTDIAGILDRTVAIHREVTVTPTFAAVTARMEIAADASVGSAMFVSAGSLTGIAASVAEPLAMSAPMRTRTKTVGFQIVGAHSSTLLACLRNGARAIAPAFAACAPQVCYEVFAAWKDGDLSLAEEKQARLIEAAQLAEATPGTLKYACDLNGYFGGLPRLPFLPPTADRRAAIKQVMKPLRN